MPMLGPKVADPAALLAEVTVVVRLLVLKVVTRQSMFCDGVQLGFQTTAAVVDTTL